jgi:predicted HAD superfamily hydrolase
MSVRNFYSLDDLVTQALQEIERFRTVSFDVFDTLLIRRVHEPDLIKGSVVRFISHLAKERSITIADSHVLWLRTAIESRIRRRNGIVHPDHEANYFEFMRKLVMTIFGPQLSEDEIQHLVDRIFNYELDVESYALVARAGWIPLLEALRERQATVVALSDMYLPGKAIRTLLDRAGIGQYFDEVYSSADSYRAKASGHGYRRLYELRGWEPRSWLHVGDNPFSDGLQAQAHGLTAWCLFDAHEKKRKAILKNYHYAARHKPFWYGRYLQQVALPLEQPQEKSAEKGPKGDQLYDLGYSFFGPLLGGYVAHLLHRSRAMNVPMLYFLSREGKLLQQLWEKMVPILAEGGPVPETHYLSVSRRALAEASCGLHGISGELGFVAFLPKGNRDFRDLCKVANLDPEPLVPVLRSHGLDVDTPLSGHHLGYSMDVAMKFVALLDDAKLKSLVCDQKRDAYEGLQRYLKSIDFFRFSDVALVDVGWLGTIQRFLDLCLAGNAARPSLHGWLLAATRGVSFATNAKSHLSGWIYDGERRDLFAGMITNYLELFEEVCRPAEPGLLGYTATGESSRIFRSETDPTYQAEMEQSRYIQPLQQGMLDAAVPLARALVLADNDPDRMKRWLVHLIVMQMGYPTADQVALLRNRYHLNDLENTGNLPRASKKSPRRLWDESDARLRYVPGLRSYYAARYMAWNLMNLL